LITPASTLIFPGTEVKAEANAEVKPGVKADIALADHRVNVRSW